MANNILVFLQVFTTYKMIHRKDCSSRPSAPSHTHLADSRPGACKFCAACILPPCSARQPRIRRFCCQLRRQRRRRLQAGGHSRPQLLQGLRHPRAAVPILQFKISQLSCSETRNQCYPAARGCQQQLLQGVWDFRSRLAVLLLSGGRRQVCFCNTALGCLVERRESNYALDVGTRARLPLPVRKRLACMTAAEMKHQVKN